MPERDELDQLIDSEIARYAQPRAGIEQRILAHVSVEKPKRSWTLYRWQYWALAGVTAALVIAILVVPRSRNAYPRTEVATARAPGPADESVAIGKSVIPETRTHTPHLERSAKVADYAARKPKSVAVPEQVQRPKLDVFPAPQPVTAQEQALLELTTRLPKAEREKLVSDDKSQPALLEISAIKISPIALPNLGKN